MHIFARNPKQMQIFDYRKLPLQIVFDSHQNYLLSNILSYSLALLRTNYLYILEDRLESYLPQTNNNG